jgi:hypothetical protein
MWLLVAAEALLVVAHAVMSALSARTMTASTANA